MTVVQVQGVHHITLNGAGRQASVDFWQGVLGMPLVMEQPNLDAREINHLYFDCGDGRLLTVFCEENRTPERGRLAQQVGSLHHLAFAVSQSSIRVAEARLKAAGLANSGIVDRGFMDSLYLREPLGLLVELACYKFDPPQGKTHGQVLMDAQKIRVARGAEEISDRDIADALIALSGAP